LSWLKRATAGNSAKLMTVWRALLSRKSDDAYEAAGLQRMALDAPRSIAERVQARLLAYALQKTRVH
ncbi:acetyl-CoA hydrolase, partial [Xanthomonas citri pv. citri]|nr:acetyl-CoA hydrolase [Xanthomonas citri pv. citri]